MKTISVKSSRGEYKIAVGRGLLSRTAELISPWLKAGRKVALVTQDPLKPAHLPKVLGSLKKKKVEIYIHTLPNGEAAKSEKELFRLLSALVNEKFERQDILIALGGGVVGDLTGFAASIFLRGIPFVNIATTLLAQVDSAIGGKTGINLPEGKNLVGAFYPPRLVVSDMETLQTLPERELAAALAEVVKYGVIHDAKLFEFLEKSSAKILGKNPEALERIVSDSSAIKAGVVSRDEFETLGERLILNFGHTLGHGFEQALRYKDILHGEAVSVGMVCAAKIAVAQKLLKQEELERLVRLLQKFVLPVDLSSFRISSQDVMRAMQRDKKKKGGKLRFVLPEKIGRVVIREDVPDAVIQNTLLEIGARK